MMGKINIEDKMWYSTGLYPDNIELHNRTRNRLIELNELGCEPNFISVSFGIEGVFSGLYIEKVWNLDNEGWENYVNWIKERKKNKS